MENLINFIKEDTAGFIALITLAVSVLSVYLSLAEYYRAKAKNDFFFIEDVFREPMRNSFHPEYLSFSIVILILVFTFYISFSEFFKIENFNWLTALIIVMTVYVISFVFNAIVFMCFQHAKNKEIKVWHKRTYRKNLFLSASSKASQWFLFALFSCLGGLGYHYLNNISWIIFGIVSGALIYLSRDYYVTKELLITHAYMFLCFEQENILYIVMATKNDKHYCVQAKKVEKTLEIYVNKILIANIDSSRKYERIYSDNISRITE